MMGFILREAWDEFRFGMKSGIAPLIFIVLTGYILLVLSKAEYLQQMGAVDIPRNAPALVYLMTSGDTFFLFFAWAWVFSQPVVRDRAARLQEIVLAAPVSLRQLLTARYLGALGVALVVGSSQIAGFLLAPLLEWLGAIPAGSTAAAPWAAIGWATLVYTLPLSAGAGALYFIAAMITRSAGGAFAVAAALMAFWMVSMIIFKDGHMDPLYAALLDPSGYAETEHQVIDRWTPREKAEAFIDPFPRLWLNRLLWCGLPLLLLALALWRVRREALVLERSPETARQGQAAAAAFRPSRSFQPALGEIAWHRVLWRETLWQTRSLLHRRAVAVMFALLLLLGIAAAFVHGVQHAYGPLVPRPELITPILKTNFYLIVVFIVAGLAGQAARRDEQPGLAEMFDAAPAPEALRLMGRAFATILLTALLALVPAASGIAVTAMVAPWSIDVVAPLAYQLASVVPALLEMAAFALLLHALIRRPGPAYAASMLAAFILIVNHEAELVPFPPYQVGLPVAIGWSGLTGLGAWAEKLAVSDGFKLAIVLLLLALAALAAPRGTDAGWRPRWLAARRRLPGGTGAVALAAGAALFAFNLLLHQRYVDDGGYESREEKLAGDAAWEARWLARQGPFDVLGGHVDLDVDPARRTLTGSWRIEGVRAATGELHAELPHGFTLVAARVGGRHAKAEIAEDHLALPLEDCPVEGCAVEIVWTLSAAGWDAETRPSWLVGRHFWLHAREVMPRLGFDPDRILRTAYDRSRFALPAQAALPPWHAAAASDAVAPGGRWSWRVGVDGRDHREGRGDGPLDFADARSGASRSGFSRLAVWHDASRAATAAAVADDVAAMGACVQARLGSTPAIDAVLQWPRDLGETTVAGDALLLAEDPHWDVTDEGTGHHVRRAAIAAALARRVVTAAADLRAGSGAAWIGQGLPGAIGLLCAAEAEGIGALAALLAHGAERTTRELAASPVPVAALAAARTDGWAADYAPLAALNWAARLSPAQIAALLAEIRQSGDVARALRGTDGDARVETYLGSPNAADLRVRSGVVSGERWRWRDGGWQADAAESVPLSLRSVGGRLQLAAPTTEAAEALVLDDWAAYEREPKDNMVRHPARR